VSHAVRTPARVELGMRLNYAAIPTPGPPMLLAILGNPELKPEHVTAYEAGYRVQPAPWVQIDATAFYNRYRDLAHLEPDTFFEPTPAPAHLVVGLKYANHDRAETHGVETLVRVQPAQRWMVEASHTLFKATVIGATDDEAVGEPVNASSPSHQWQVKSRLTLPADVELDATLFRVGSVGVDAALGADVPSYSRLDLRLGWTFYRMFGVSLVGQNLLESDHVEFNGIDGLVGSRIPRTVAARVTWQF
jgi:iron complex outermembrane receptor protein